MDAARAKTNGVTPYGPSLQSGSVNVGALGGLRDEPALRMMDLDSTDGIVVSPTTQTPNLQRRPSTGGGSGRVHFRDTNGSSTHLPARGRTTPDPLRSGNPDPDNPGTRVLRVPAPAGSASAVPRRMYFPTVAAPAPSADGEDKSEYGGAVTGLAPSNTLDAREISVLARSDRAAVADSVWAPSPKEIDGGVGAGEVRAGRGVVEDGETVASYGVERGSADGVGE
ncbi:hypothetical protein FRC07_006420 [Ceratobasidium sp. 392]|nr:hypothetical protein FRC07_006420 [Ceratobasidium sp. 392]